MRKLLYVFLAVIFMSALACHAQGPPTAGYVVYQNYVPVGTCNLPAYLIVANAGTQAGVFQCKGVPLVWTLVGSVNGDGVGSINGNTGNFTFNGPGVSCVGTICTFTGSGSGIGNIVWSIPSWLTATPTTISASGTQQFTPTTGQASHRVIGTCGTATTFGPCALVAGDIPSLPYIASSTQLPVTNAGALHQFLATYNSVTGLFTTAQPSASDLSTGALVNGITATTQAPGDNTTKLATDAFVLANAGGSGPTLQTNGVGNGSQALLNFITSTINTTGLTVTPINSVGTEKYEVSGTINAGSVATLNQNTTGTAANLSGTPALPNGTTATTQTTGDNTTKLATDAFVLANAGSGHNSVGSAGAVQMAGAAGAFADTGCTADGAGTTTCVANRAASFTGTGTTPTMASFPAGTGSIPALPANSGGFAAPVTGGTAYLYKLAPTATAGVLHTTAPATGDGVLESLLTSSPVSLTADVSNILPVVNGGTGTSTPAIVAGTNVTVSGTWPNQTVNSTGGSSSNSAQAWPALNGGTGTGANLLAGWNNLSNDSNFAQTFPHPTVGQSGTNANPPMIGVCISNCATSGLGSFQYQGAVQWICDNVVGVGDWVGPSPITDGQCHDPVINTGVNSQQVNENPEANSAIGIALVANGSPGTAATILLMPHMGYGQTIFGGNTGQGFAMTSFGSPFTTTSEWTQRSLTSSGLNGHAGAFSGHHPIDIWGTSGAGFCSIDNGDGGRGIFGFDQGYDCLTNGQGSPPGESFYWNVSQYTIPTALTCTGSVGISVTKTTGLYSCTLTGNTTFTISQANIGHEVTFDLKQAAGSAFTVTWPGNFINAPVMTTTLGASIVAKFYYDGTSYTCTGGCPVVGGGTLTAIGVTTANGVSGTSSGGTTPNLTIALGAITPTTVNGATVALGGSSNMLIGTGTMPAIQSIVVGTSVGANVGNNATIMGNQALSGATGGGNTGFGQGVMGTITSESFTGVDAFGQGAGSANSGSVAASMFLGDGAVAGAAALTNVNCIGQNQTCNTSNQTVLGNASITSTLLRGLVQAPGVMSTGTKFTTSGCSVSSTTGGATAGIFTLGANSCTVVVTMNGATGMTATNGWTCQAHDRTAVAALIGGESSSTTTTASITIPATLVGATDVISFSCTAY